MTLLVRAFPVSGRREVETFTSEIRDRHEETRRFYTSLGVRREGWYFQDSEDGPMVIGVTDVDGPIERRAEEYAENDDIFSLWFKQRIYDISGVDPNETPKGPPTEQVFDSSGRDVDPSVRLVVRAYPVLSRDALVDFANQLQERRNRETANFYDGFQVLRETWHVQHTARGPIAIAVAALGNPEDTGKEFADSKDDFAVWFKQKVQEVTGVDPNVTPLGPPSEQVFEFRA
jgi:hypothetical protein